MSTVEKYGITPEQARDTYRAVLEGMGFKNLDELVRHGVSAGRRVGEQGRENGEATSALCDVLRTKVSYLTTERNEAIEALADVTDGLHALMRSKGVYDDPRVLKARALLARIKESA